MSLSDEPFVGSIKCYWIKLALASSIHGGGGGGGGGGVLLGATVAQRGKHPKHR